MFLSVCAFSVMDIIVKWSQHYPLGEVLFFRGFFGVIFYLFIIPSDRRKNFYYTKRAGLHFLRCAFGLIALVSIFVEGPLSYKKLQIGKASNNSVIIAEAKETLFCLNLSVLVIVGVGVNYFTDLWYFDPIAALLMIPWLLYEFSQHK